MNMTYNKVSFILVFAISFSDRALQLRSSKHVSADVKLSECVYPKI